MCKSRVHTVDGKGVFQSDIHTHAGKAVTRGVFWVFEHPPKFQGKIKTHKNRLLLVTKFSKVTTGYPRYTHVFGSYK